ncbi:L-serine ammonia-lyase [Labrenzia sp. PHM005]|uniref:L-serine ammonia-lyase n=1 Tax=Labrenzia sp. PHM005 TaxID=2590016 RepID=UPI001140295E|nr:L-serine ammonia-lyase [Labrenzia sp. PHM005]QDG76253.1 L-serine ammonia-lyase [Labrenzia sp. PHM005]
MFLSVFDIFKIGIGPSSSHTMGPMTAAVDFLDKLKKGEGGRFDPRSVARIRASLHGSLAFTGKGHATDRAVMLGLLGFRPDAVNADLAEQQLGDLQNSEKLTLPECGDVAFSPEADLTFDYGPALPYHANGMRLTALDASGEVLLTETYYSIGGGFVMTEAELIASEKAPDADLHQEQEAVGYPYPFGSASEMLEMGEASNLSIAEMKRINEETALGPDTLTNRLDAIWTVMNACIDRGLEQEGTLPGGLSVKRRARAIHQRLLDQSGANSKQPHTINDWLSVYAMAVNEENAAGGQVVTSPTNGAAGVVPAVIRYYRDHCVDVTREGIDTFLLTAAAIGGLIKHNASISGAECGCQAEVGSASAMAAAGLCAALGGSNAQIENAAEIALEHHLGMTCDPVKGLVQVPCIERNGMGAIKAVSAASLALHGDGSHFMPLDNCIETMRQTGQDMREKYKETSLGGLAVNLPEC